MRPLMFYACFAEGLVFGVFEGATAARRACGGRRTYRAFSSRLDAEEYAAWWNYAATLPGGHLHWTPNRTAGRYATHA